MTGVTKVLNYLHQLIILVSNQIKLRIILLMIYKINKLKPKTINNIKYMI